MIKDVVCSRPVDQQQAESQELYSEREGQRFYFCSSICKQKFDLTPGSFIQLMPEEFALEEDRAWE
jgi:YHS domain-containing protein